MSTSLLAYKTSEVIIECHRKLPCIYEALEIQDSLELQQYQTPIILVDRNISISGDSVVEISNTDKQTWYNYSDKQCW